MPDDNPKNPAVMKFLVLGVVRNEKNEVLIVRRAKEETVNGAVLRWAFPGGKPLVSESRDQFVKREVLEETGYEVRPVYQLSVRRHPQLPMDMAYYLCQLVSKEPVAKPKEPDEIAEIKWVKPEELKNYFTTDLDPKVARELGVG